MVSCSPGAGSACSPLLAIMSFYEHSRFTFQANSVPPEERRRTKMDVLRLFALCLHFLLVITENVSCGIRRVLHQQPREKNCHQFLRFVFIQGAAGFLTFLFSGLQSHRVSVQRIIWREVNPTSMWPVTSGPHPSLSPFLSPILYPYSSPFYRK